MEALSALIARYGIAAIFLGCMLEGESVAVVGGFFAHQGILLLVPSFAAALVGAFLGDCALYLAGRRFAEAAWVRKMRGRTGFSHALDLAGKRPRPFVFFNRFVYGMRLIGGVAAGLARIPLGLFLFWNLLSSTVWAGLFFGGGYFFGLGAEALLGKELREHERLIVACAIIVVLFLVGTTVAKRIRRREARLKAEASARRAGGSGE